MICSLLEIRFHGPGRLEENSEGWVGHGEEKERKKSTLLWECVKGSETWKCMNVQDFFQWVETGQIKWGAEIHTVRLTAYGQTLEHFEPRASKLCICFANK